MTFTCRVCKRTFATKVRLELHKDTCSEGKLFCDECGERFDEGVATEDGWRYRCPNGDCEGSGIGEDLHRVDDVRQPIS
jgi:hypothetical protein